MIEEIKNITDKWIKKYTSFVLILIISLSVISFVAIVDVYANIDRRQADREKVHQQYKEEIDELKEEVATLQGNIETLEEELKLVDYDIWKVAADTWGIDWKLLKAISYFETGRLKSPLWKNSNNPGGITCGSRYCKYISKEVGIIKMAELLRKGYIDKGLDTIDKIHKKYAPPGAKNDPNKTNIYWPSHVKSIYKEFE